MFSAAASCSSASCLVPDTATVAPRPCNARAIAPPMPPVAPVTSAVLPLRSNIKPSRVSSATCGFERRNVFGRADGNAIGAIRDALDEGAQDFAGADLVECLHIVCRH